MTKPEVLLRAYPKAWRERYGEEFAALLADDFAERPHDISRDLDVVRAGLAARLASPATTLAALLLFLAAATSIWNQLARGNSAAHPGTTAVTLGLVTLSICGLAVATIAVAGAISLTVAATRAIRNGQGHNLIRPATAIAIGAVTLIVGAARMARTPTPRTRSPGGPGPRPRPSVPTGSTRLGWRRCRRPRSPG